MALKNNIHLLDQRRQNQKNYDDSPLRIDIRQSILDLRPIYKEMTNEQFSNWYQRKYRINAKKVLEIITAD